MTHTKRAELTARNPEPYAKWVNCKIQSPSSPSGRLSVPVSSVPSLPRYLFVEQVPLLWQVYLWTYFGNEAFSIHKDSKRTFNQRILGTSIRHKLNKPILPEVCHICACPFELQ